MITVRTQDKLGKFLWQYVVCRTVAEKKGFEFHIPSKIVNPFELDFGIDHYQFVKEWSPQNTEGYYDETIWDINDFTKLDTDFSSEKYFIDHRDEILTWFNLDETPFIPLTEDVCVINFRAYDYESKDCIGVPKKYFDDSIEVMRGINPQMKFAVVTDDVLIADRYFHKIPIYHYGSVNDFNIVSKANYLIIGNSNFSWWAAWLNQNANLIIAPKYWKGHNNSSWSPSDILSTRFNYVDADGILFTYDNCLSEII